MQTLTLFFGFAIVAIAMENFAAKFVFGKTSDAGAKGHQEFQSRDYGNGNRYFLRGATGTEKVIIRDGNSTKKENLNKENKELFATNSKITIEFTNDECCEPTKPDKNVLFTPGGLNYKISTHNNVFPTNYLEKWNCSTCSTSKTHKKDLQSRMPKVDECYKTRTGDDCTKCEVVKSGLFCYPGNYTVEFETENQCENVTFGGCDIPVDIHFKDEPTKVADAEACNRICTQTQRCNWYRYDRQKQQCQMMETKYRSEYCNIRAGPRSLTATQCLYRENDNWCDSIVEEDCEYNGKGLTEISSGDAVDSDDCQTQCEIRSECQYWIWHDNEARCILKRDMEKSCNVSGGQKLDVNEYKHCKREFHKDQK